MKKGNRQWWRDGHCGNVLQDSVRYMRLTATRYLREDSNLTELRKAAESLLAEIKREEESEVRNGK